MIEYVAKHSHIRAVEVAAIIDGKPSPERHFVIHGVGILDADTFRALYSEKVCVPVETPAPKPKRETTGVRRNGRPVERDSPQAPAPAVATSTTPLTTHRSGEPTLRARILTLLEKGGRTSRDLFESLYKAGVATTQGSVYQTCADLKHDGLVESRRDEGDGVQKYFRKAVD